MRVIRVSCGLAVFLGAALVLPADTVGGARLYLPPGPGQYVRDLVVDPDGTVWVIVNNKVYYIEDGRFREPATGELPCAVNKESLLGGPDRGAYVTQPGQKEHEGRLYRLMKGSAEFVTAFYDDDKHDPAGLYISKSGMIVNWGSRFLARLGTNGWDRLETRSNIDHLTAVSDLGDTVCFHCESNLYRVAREGLTILEIRGTPWGHDKLLYFDKEYRNGFRAVDRESGREIELDAVRRSFREKDVFNSAYPMPDGSVWVFNAPEDNSDWAFGAAEVKSDKVFFRLDAGGSVSSFVTPHDFPWPSGMYGWIPDSVLACKGGEIVIGLPEEGVAVWRNGKLTRYGWREGYPMGVRHLQEDPQGIIWASGDQAVLWFHPQSVPFVPAPFADWTEYRLSDRSPIWETRPGELAMFREDKPEMISRWDGTEWRFQPVPFTARNIGRSMVDDQGHLIVAVHADQDGVYDVGPGRVSFFENMEKLLAHALKRGVRSFSQFDGFQGAVVTGTNRLWFGYRGYPSVYMIEGSRTEDFTFRGELSALFTTASNDVLVCSRGGPLYRYDRGQMVEAGVPDERIPGLLLSEHGLHRYQGRLAREAVGCHYPVLRNFQDNQLFFNAEDFEAFQGGVTNVPSARIGYYLQRLNASCMGGAWLEYSQGAESPHRVFGHQLLELDMARTPIPHFKGRKAREDGRGNLWIETDYYEGAKRVFMRRLQDVQVRLEPVPAECGRQMPLRSGVAPASYEAEFCPFVKVGDADWTRMETSGPTLIHFPQTGVYTVQVCGLIMGARLTSSPSFTVSAAAGEEASPRPSMHDARPD